MSTELWANRGKFYIHVGTETLVCHQCIGAPQRPTGGPSDKTRFKMRAKGGKEASSQLPQHLPGTSEGSKGGAPCYYHREPWAG